MNTFKSKSAEGVCKMKGFVQDWIDALVEFDDNDLAELEKGIKEARAARREEAKNKAIQNFKKAYFELLNWANIYYDVSSLDYDETVALLGVFDNFTFK